MAFLLAMVMVVGLSATAFAADTSSYTDVATTHWAHSSIESCKTKGLMQGIGNGIFDPEGTLTRAQVAQICYNKYGDRLGEYTNEILFDIESDAWYYRPMYWAIGNNLIDGITETNRIRYGHPESIADRKCVALMLYRIANKMGVTLPKNNEAVVFPDIGDLSDEYQKAISALQQSGVIAGFPDGRYGPNESLTRAQAAKLIDIYTNIEGLGLAAPGEPPEAMPPESDALLTPDKFYSALEYYASYYGYTMEKPAILDLEIGSISDIHLTNGSCTIHVKYYYTPNMSHESFAYYVFDSSWNEIAGSERFIHDIDDLKPILKKYSN